MLIALVIVSGISFQIISMQTAINPFCSTRKYRESRFPRTPLHCAAMLDFAITNSAECSWRDEIKAQMAAKYIIENNAQVDDLDNCEISAYEYAEVNQWRLPKLWKVMKAGKLVQDIQKRNPPILEIEELIEWHEALILLIKCADPKSQ